MTAAAAPVTPTALQTRVSAELSERLGTYTGRLAWDADQLASHQQQRLRTLLAHAAEHSPFHRRRLGGLDPSHFQLSDLARLAVCRSAARRRFRDRVRGPRGARAEGCRWNRSPLRCRELTSRTPDAVRSSHRGLGEPPGDRHILRRR
jgi:hypothetical protein